MPWSGSRQIQPVICHFLLDVSNLQSKGSVVYKIFSKHVLGRAFNPVPNTIYQTSLIFSNWFKILIALEHVTCRVTFWQVMLSSVDVIYILTARAARSSVIKRDKRVADSFVSILSQGIAKPTKGTAKTHL